MNSGWVNAVQNLQCQAVTQSGQYNGLAGTSKAAISYFHSPNRCSSITGSGHDSFQKCVKLVESCDACSPEVLSQSDTSLMFILLHEIAACLTVSTTVWMNLIGNWNQSVHLLLTGLFFPIQSLLYGMAMYALLQPMPLLFLDRLQTTGMITIKGTYFIHGRSWRRHMHWWWR